MNLLKISKNGTQTIEKTYKTLQLINLITTILLSLTAIIFGIYGVMDDEEVIAIVGFASLVVIIPPFFIITLINNVKLGMYYDIIAM